MDALGEVFRGPTRHTPVSERDFELGEPRKIRLVKIRATERSGRNRCVPLLRFILLWNGNVDEIIRLDERAVPELDKDVVRLDICRLISKFLSVLGRCREMLTCVDDVVIVSKVDGQHKLNGEPAHYCVWDPAFSEPSAKTPKRLSHEFKHKTHVSSVGTLVFKVVKEVANVIIAHQILVPVSKVGKNLPLEYRFVPAIGFGTEYFQRYKPVLIFVTKNKQAQRQSASRNSIQLSENGELTVS